LHAIVADAGVREIGWVTIICRRVTAGARELETDERAGGFLVHAPICSQLDAHRVWINDLSERQLGERQDGGNESGFERRHDAVVR